MKSLNDDNTRLCGLLRKKDLDIMEFQERIAELSSKLGSTSVQLERTTNERNTFATNDEELLQANAMLVKMAEQERLKKNEIARLKALQRVHKIEMENLSHMSDGLRQEIQLLQDTLQQQSDMIAEQGERISQAVPSTSINTEQVVVLEAEIEAIRAELHHAKEREEQLTKQFVSVQDKLTTQSAEFSVFRNAHSNCDSLAVRMHSDLSDMRTARFRVMQQYDADKTVFAEKHKQNIQLNARTLDLTQTIRLLREEVECKDRLMATNTTVQQELQSKYNKVEERFDRATQQCRDLSNTICKLNDDIKTQKRVIDDYEIQGLLATVERESIQPRASVFGAR